jgi:hypothetical protein
MGTIMIALPVDAQRRVYGAMATAVDRANDAENQRRSIPFNESAYIEHLESLLDEKDAIIHQLKSRLSDVDLNTTSERYMIYNNRPVIKAKQAAENVGVSLATVSRYCTSGYWEAVSPDGNHWYIYADVALTKKRK